MVNFVRPACFSPPADGSLLKSQSSETVSLESTSFGEIFKAKEKERKQLEDSAFSAAAAMSAVVRTPPAEKPAEPSNSDTGDRVGSVSGKSENQSQSGSGNISSERLKTSANQKSYSSEKTDSVESKSAEKQAEATDQAQKSASQAFAAALDAQEKASADQSAAKIDAASVKAVEAQMADQVEVVSAQAVPVASPIAQSQMAVAAEANPSAVQAVQTGVVSQANGEAQESDGAVVVEATPTAQLTETDQAQGSVPTPSSGSGLETAGKQEDAQADGKQAPADGQAVSNSETREAGGLSGGVKVATLVQPNAQAGSKTQAAQLDPKAATSASVGEELPAVGTSQDANPVLTAQPAPTTSPVTETVDMKAAGKWAAPQINTQSGEVIQQIVRQMHVTLQTGPGTMRLQLNPKELGAIDVQMVQSAQGVSVTFFAEHGSTGRLLETQMDQLRQSLANSGIQLSNLNISQQGLSGQQGGGNKQAFQFAQQPNTSAGQPEKKTEIETRERPERIVGKLQGVDYRI